MYLSAAKAEQLLRGLRENFHSVRRFFVGNMPDREKKDLFFGNREHGGEIDDDPRSYIGLWWEHREFEALASRTGWRVSFRTMPEEFYAHHYRFDAILEPL
jgi:hypothetical protein